MVIFSAAIASSVCDCCFFGPVFLGSLCNCGFFGPGSRGFCDAVSLAPVFGGLSAIVVVSLAPNLGGFCDCCFFGPSG